MKKILLIDIENCGQALHQLAENLESYTQIHVVYATSNVNLSLDELYLLIPFIQNKRFNLVKMSKAGKDAADFGLAFIAGQLSQQYQQEDTSFEIISNDHALGYVAELLQRQNFNVEVKTKKIAPQPNEALEKLLSTLAKVNNKPTSEDAFLNSIMSWTKVDRTQAYQLLQKILQLDVLTPSEKSNLIPVIKPHLLFLKQYCQYLNKQQGKPATKESLINSIQKVMKIDKESTALDRYNLLIKNKIITESNQKHQIQYNKAVIKTYL